MVKIRRELVGTQNIEPKCIEYKGIYREPNLSFQNGDQREKHYMRALLKSDVTLMVVSYIYILRNVVSYPKTRQSCFSVKKV